MSSQWIPEALRAAVRERAGGRCEYCGIHEDDVLYPHEPDHIIAEQHGGGTELENLALACVHCNRRKGPNIASVDPETGQIVALFHPRKERWQACFRLDDARIIALTPGARATARLLEFNAPERLRLRRALLAIGRYFGGL